MQLPASTKPSNYPTWQYCVYALFLAGTVVSLLFNAWTSDDAFFTFRVVDNFLHGYGLRFNIPDRVQVYTNPLWMLVHIPFMAVFDNIAYVTIGLSFACAITSIWLVTKALNLPPLHCAIFFLLPFALSRTITQFFSSGLENPMTSLMFAWFFYEIIRHEKPRFFWLTLIVSLSMVNRMDTVLAYAPIMGYLGLRNIRALPWKQVFLGMLPILAWMGFSLLYHGFIFPNTKYAKIGADLPVMNYFYVGMYYIMEFAMSDPMITSILLCAAVLTLTVHLKSFRNEPKNYDHVRILFMGFGMILYSIYVARVGGSYISCLFMSLPAFMGLCLFAHTISGQFKTISATALLGLAVLFVTTDSLAEAKFWNDVRVPIARKFRVSNFKPEYLLNFDKKTFTLTMNKYQKRFEPCDDDSPVFLTYGKGGRGSYYGNWCRYQMGKYALSDALLARLPSAIPRIGRISHIPRTLPEGYPYALETGDLSKMHPLLQEYYRPLELIIRGDIFDPERLATLARFNLGYYDYYRREYLDAMERECAPTCKRIATGWPNREEEQRLNQLHKEHKPRDQNDDMNFDPDNEDQP